MKLCHTITIRVFTKPDEDPSPVLHALHSLYPFDLTTEKIPLLTTKALLADEKSQIIITEVILDKDKHINAFLSSFTKKLTPDQKSLLLRQENRLDEHHNFYIRLDKPKLIEGVYWITDGGNCYHIRMNIASFPKTKEKSMTVVKTIFSS